MASSLPQQELGSGIGATPVTPDSAIGQAVSPGDPAPEGPKSDAEREEGADRHPDPEFVDPAPEGLRTFQERARAVLLTPSHALRHHDAGWGWAAPWLIVSLIGILAGVLYLAKVDVVGLQKAAAERAMASSPLGGGGGAKGNPKAEEAMDTIFRFGAFMAKVGAIAGPPLIGLLGILMFGFLVFMICRAPPGAKGPYPSPIHCMSLVAWISLVSGLQYVARGLGTLLGGDMAMTGPNVLADPIDHNVIHTALSRLDPFTIFWYVLLGIGLHLSCKTTRRRAWVSTLLLYGGFSVLLVGLAALGAMAQSMGGGR